MASSCLKLPQVGFKLVYAPQNVDFSLCFTVFLSLPEEPDWTRNGKRRFFHCCAWVCPVFASSSEHQQAMVFIWFSYVFVWFCIWFSYGFHLVFIWFSYGFLTMIHKDSQGSTRTHKDSQGLTRIRKDSQQGHKDSQGLTTIHKDSQGFARIHKD